MAIDSESKYNREGKFLCPTATPTKTTQNWFAPLSFPFFTYIPQPLVLVLSTPIAISRVCYSQSKYDSNYLVYWFY